MRVLASADMAQIEALIAADEFFWLDLEAPSADVLEALGRRLGWHELAVEDLIAFGQRPKMDPYGDHMLLVFYGARLDADGRASPTEVHLVVTGNYIVTVRREPCSELAELRRRFAAKGETGEQYVVYAVLDTLTDTFFPVLAQMDDAIDGLEEQIVEGPSDEQLHRIFSLKRSLVVLRRVVTPQRDLAARTLAEIVELPGLDASAHDYFRDVYDHLIRISDLIDSYRDLLTSSMDVYLSTVSNRLNVVMKQLTIVATIFLPISALTGFFGQNFGWLVRNINTLGAFLLLGVGGIVVSCVLLLTWFRRSGFLD